MKILIPTLFVAILLGWWLGANVPSSIGWVFGMVLGLFGGIPAVLIAHQQSKGL